MSAGKNGALKARLVKGKLTPPMPVPDSIALPPYAKSGVNPPYTEKLEIHDAEVRTLEELTC